MYVKFKEKERRKRKMDEMKFVAWRITTE